MAMTATVMVAVAVIVVMVAVVVDVVVVMMMMVVLLMVMLVPLTFYRIPSECRLQFLRDISHTCMQAARVPFKGRPSGMAPPCRHGS